MRALAPDDFARMLGVEQLGAKEQAMRESALSVRDVATPDRNTKRAPPQLISANFAHKGNASEPNATRRFFAKKGIGATRQGNKYHF